MRKVSYSTDLVQGRCEDIKATKIKYTGRGEEGPVELDLATRLQREAEKGNV